MKYIIGNPRNQAPLIPISLEEQTGQDNEVRVIDLFVDNLPLATFGFKVGQGENDVRAIILPGFKGLQKAILKLFTRLWRWHTTQSMLEQ